MVNQQEENAIMQTLDMDAEQWYKNNPNRNNYWEAKATAMKLINCTIHFKN
jgi:hypothetical protein